MAVGCGPADANDANDSTGSTDGTDAGDGTDNSSGSNATDMGGAPATAHRSCGEDQGVIVALPDDATAYATEGFDRYAEVLAPNGKPIRIFAQTGVDPLVIYRARNLLRFFVTDVADTTYGANKGAVANAMADNGAVLVLPRGAHEEGNEPNVPAQPLYEAETPIDGSPWYLDNDYEHRDAALEEIFHLVHDTGIGTDFPGALPEYQTALLAEAEAAIDDGRWGIAIDPEVSQWLDGLAAENSLAQEYIASVIDSYYGLWAPWSGRGGMWGIYIAKTRAQVATLDPAGQALLEQFLPPMLDYEARLHPDLEGTFSLTLDPAQPYTHKSQYLRQATLTGSRDAGLLGNAADNVLRGNAGDNALHGGGGEDTVVYCSEQAAYVVSLTDDGVVIDGPDGRDTLVDIESVHFADAIVAVADLGR